MAYLNGMMDGCGLMGMGTFGSLYMFLLTLLLLGLVIVLFLWIVKLWRQVMGKKK